MPQRSITRRRFLRRTSTGAVVFGTTALLARQARAANARLSIGIIGTGGRGTALMSQISPLAAEHNVEITALCDVWRVNLAKAASRVEASFGRQPRQFTRFGELLALDDVDAVVIATPDFRHTPIMIEALKADKDVYVEKPMSMKVELANEALDLARSRDRVVQVGTQRRSEGTYRAAAEELATGTLGHISRISIAVNFNHERWARPYTDCKAQDVDWDAFLLNRPERPFDARLLRQWHLYREFTNGLSGLWMSHYTDSVHLLTGAKYPTSAVAHGGTYVWKQREHTDTFHALLDYPEGFLMDWGMGLANSAGSHFVVHGTEGTLDAQSWTISPAGGRKGSAVGDRKIAGQAKQSHMGNWLACLRSRERPAADIQYGHQHAVATIMAATALETGQRQKYEPQTRKMVAG